jgi:hypothetical protein
MPGALIFSTTADGAAAVTERMRIDSSGNLLFNSGYGSVATAYGCRAWVNFDGTTNVGGNCTIRASGNISTVADNTTGDYTLNFSTALPDGNYSCVINTNNGLQYPLRFSGGGVVFSTTTTTCQIKTSYGAGASTAGAASDFSIVTVAIFR